LLSEVNEHYSDDKIKRWILNYASTKTCGKDGIHIVILKCLVNSNALKHIGRLFRAIAFTGLIPKEWNLTVTSPIPKVPATNGSVTIDQCRPIGLTSVLRRVFEGLTLNRIESDPELSNAFRTNFGQGGFKKGNMTLYHALSAQEFCRRLNGVQ
ncbi:hypothetical protein MP638_002674, partial [Amoeboaphelidium occidentale]